MAAQGAKVVLGVRRTDRLEAIVGAIELNGGEAACLEIDVTRREDVDRLTALAVEHFGRLDVMVNNAGINQL